MEGYKDVLLSQPPAMYEKTAQLPHISLENYKGILLCARPVNLPRGASHQLRGEAAGAGMGVLTPAGDPAPAFVPSGAGEKPAGLAPSAEERARMERNHKMRLENYKTRRANACTVLTRHKRWLRSFADQVRKMKDDEIQREIELARRAEQMRQQQAQKRAETQVQHPCSPHNHNNNNTHDSVERAREIQQQRAIAEEEENKKAAAKNKAKASKKKKKPKWALTEDEALDDELAEADDLLEFAKNLDYEKFITDYEVAGALAIMRERVEEIARENNWSKEALERAATESVADDMEDAENDNESNEGETGARQDSKRQTECRTLQKQSIGTLQARKAAAPRHTADHAKGWDGSTGIGSVLRRAIFRDTLQLAERILASSASMQKIHTKFSLARILQRCVLDGTDANEAMQKPSIGGNVGLEKEPRVVKIHPDATGFETGNSRAEAGSQRVLVEMQRSKERTQGLPYLYRCPAI